MKANLGLHHHRDSFWGFLKLLTSGVIAAGGLALIASNRLRILANSDIVFLLIFIQWQTFGLMVAKMGIEQVIFAAVSRDQEIFFSLYKTLFKQIIPTALLFSIGTLWVFSPIVGLVIGMSIVLDSYSLIVMSDFNARRKYNEVSWANLLNYPVFFLLLVCLAIFRRIGESEILGAFLASSLIRTAWLAWRRDPPLKNRIVAITAIHKIGIQQVLNYFLFRADQLFLGLLWFRNSTILTDKEFLSMYLFLSKFPELAAGVITVAGAVILPEIKLLGESNIHELRNFIGRRWVFALGALGGMLICMKEYRGIWHGPSISWWIAMPFLIHTVFIFPLNAVSYMMMAQGYMGGLLRKLIIANTFGFTIFVLLYWTSRHQLTGWVVPAQQGVFLSIVLWFGWGKKKDIYV